MQRAVVVYIFGSLPVDNRQKLDRNDQQTYHTKLQPTLD